MRSKNSKKDVQAEIKNIADNLTKIATKKPRKKRKAEYAEYAGVSSDALFALQEGVIAQYQTIIGQKVRENAIELIDTLIQGALDGDVRVALELVKTYMPERVIVGIKELKADSMKDINYAANKILEAKTKGHMDANLADDLLKNLLDRMNFVMADELEEKIEQLTNQK